MRFANSPAAANRQPRRSCSTRRKSAGPPRPAPQACYRDYGPEFVDRPGIFRRARQAAGLSLARVRQVSGHRRPLRRSVRTRVSIPGGLGSIMLATLADLPAWKPISQLCSSMSRTARTIEEAGVLDPRKRPGRPDTCAVKV